MFNLCGYSVNYDNVLGTGAKSIVYSGTCQKTNKEVAVKIIDTTTCGGKMYSFIDSEIKLLEKIKDLNNPYFVKLLEVRVESVYTILIMERIMCEELYEYCITYGTSGMSEARFKPIFRNICNAVLYLHSNDIVHLDLKLENIMYDKNTGKITIIDFGFAKCTTYLDIETNKYVQKKLSEYSGSMHYCSPEILTYKEYDGKKSDIWSLGVILYASLVGCFPFDNYDQNKIRKTIQIGKYRIPNISTAGISLLMQMLEKDPNERLSIDEVLDHEWLQ